MRRFAEDTTVSVTKSRGEIDDLLRAWHCDGIRWTDNFRDGVVTLEFTWSRDGVDYLARFTLQLPTEEEMRTRAIDLRTRRVSDVKLRKVREAAGRHEHRVLLLWLKAALNAVAAGLIDPATIFLPFLVGRNGQTVAEAALPRLAKLLEGSALALLPAPE